MPYRDGTGPLGTGPIGRGLGPCGRGMGFRRGGFGRGYWRFGYAPAQAAAPVQYTKEDEIADLRAEKELVERDLKAIEERLKELEKKK